jgi:hypothetical protein
MWRFVLLMPEFKVIEKDMFWGYVLMLKINVNFEV